MFCMDHVVLQDEVGEGEDDSHPSFVLGLEVDLAFDEEFGFGVAE